MNDNPIIVIVAYNRASSLDRLLKSLKKAKYPKDGADLFISIDQGNTNLDVLEKARDFAWPYGKKTVDYQESNLGLRKHILKCMTHVQGYCGLIMLEDDLFVSPEFYLFTKDALKFIGKDENIAGVSLYKHEYNVHKTQNFLNVNDGFDNWFFQFASSWGQAWTKEQIDAFLAWYKTNTSITSLEEIPKYVREWSDKSWLKYFIAYTVLHKKYFLYPSVSLTTNFGEQGSHMSTNTAQYQVPLVIEKQRPFHFSSLTTSMAIYDSFFENETLHSYLNLKKNELTVDLYGYKEIYTKRFILTTKLMDFEIVKTFGKKLKPHDLNIIFNVPGKDIFLYNTTTQKKNQFRKDRVRNLLYDYKNVSLKDSIILLRENLFLRLKSYAKRFF
jgi:hypothetical protein